ncbi:dipeptidase [Phenylobacterium sp.]|uniref:dipeptidase n=1 Tax=Phenylobacterium sp. TaxID=1871053 RepID=UPI0035B0483F
MSVRTALLAAALLASAAFPATAQGRADRSLHEGLTVLDTHFDTPALFHVEGWDILDRHDVARDGSQVDLPRMIDGGVDGGVFVVFTAQGPRTPEGHAAARDFALVRINEIREMAARNHQQFRIVTTAAEARALANGKTRFVFISLENSYPLGRDLSLMKTFHELGARMMSPVHFRNNDLADSATDKPEHNGLSPLGRQWVAEANRVGIVIDASHASDASTEQMIELSKAPIILSHSGVRAVYDHPRNLPDDLLRKLAAKGGVIQLNAVSSYVAAAQAPNPERDKALAQLGRKYGDEPKTLDLMRKMTAERNAVLARYGGAKRASLDDFVRHIDHAIKVAGIDHVGVSGDFDGGGGVEGFDGAADFPNLTAALRARGYSRNDVAKIMGGNALRVFDQAQAAAAR